MSTSLIKGRLLQENLIPLDKSWMIRMGVLDIIHGHHDIEKFLENDTYIGDDLKALHRAAINWRLVSPIDVGESGTLLRMLRFASWKLKLKKEFVLRGTLKDRKITNNPKIIHLKQPELLKLDNGTSQWATAAVLLGDKERLQNAPFKLQLTYEAVEHWLQFRKQHNRWQPRYDETILKQALTYFKILAEDVRDFIPEQAEDYCFARVFGFIDADEGERRWPSLRGHESDRIDEMEKMIVAVKNHQPITSKDHRVVQALAMWAKVKKIKVVFQNKECVAKSWPQFWPMIETF